MVAIILVAVLGGSCRAPGRIGEGGECDVDSDCAGDLACQTGRCRVDPQLHHKMASQSGVAVTMERVGPTGATAGSVKIRRAHGRGFAFAVCGDDERLVGGWCSPLTVGSDNTSTVRQSASGYSEHDTVGAQWKCDFPQVEVTAFAMCQKLLVAERAPATDIALPETDGGSAPPYPDVR